jgi:hypothetical protein
MNVSSFTTKAHDIVRVTLHGTIIQLTTRKLTVAGSSTVDAAGQPEKVEGQCNEHIAAAAAGHVLGRDMQQEAS